MVKPILYSLDFSPPVRSVRLVGAALGVEFDIRPVDFLGGEHLKEWFVKLNPQHTVPTLDDNGKVIWDSHAIAGYLVQTYGKDDSLYPKDPYHRARVDQRLHFITGVLFARLRHATYPIFFGQYADVPKDRLEAIVEAYDLLEAFLKTDPYLVGNTLTIADLCTIPTVTQLNYHVPIDAKKYPKIIQWIERVSKLPYYEEMSGKLVPKLNKLLDDLKANYRAKSR